VRVLLVDDNRDDRALVLRALAGQQPSLEAIEVTDADGLTVALARPPDLVITDYQLRFTDGLTVLRQVREVWPDTPVIMYTGTGSEEVAVEAMKAGLDDYVLKKPGEMPRLLAAVRRLLESARHRKAAEEAEGRYRKLFDGVPIGLFRAAPDGSLLDCNMALVRMLGYPDRQALLAGKTRDSYVDAGDRPALMERLVREGSIRDYEARRLRHDGAAIWARTSVQAVKDEAGNMVYYEGLVEDLTERKQAEEALRAAEGRLLQAAKLEAVGRLAGGVAHDFNNLLGVIMGYADLMAKRIGGEDPLRRNVQEIQKAAERASALTKQLLAFSRRQVLQPRVLDIHQTIREVESMLQRLIGEDIALVTVLREEVGRVKADPGQFQQVLMNLAVNARDAMPDGGTLTVETANVDLSEDYARKHLGVVAGPYVQLAVSDTGVGMTPDVQAHIFEPFFTTKGPEKGTGLGLATVYGIIKQSGGNIWVYSEPGRGTTFKVYLPRVDERAAAGVLVDPPPDLRRGYESVLLVEDDDKVREVVSMALRDAGYTVLEARGGAAALTLAGSRTEPIHLVITDLVMPGMSGRELVERWSMKHPETRALFMSGYTDATAHQRGGLPAGAAFIQKPFAPSALARKVREVLDERLEDR
jgi:two-component system, cell cycle sensor histidine kinase and response regulator CckA